MIARMLFENGEGSVGRSGGRSRRAQGSPSSHHQDRTGQETSVSEMPNAMPCIGVVGAETRREARRELAAQQWDEVVDQRDQTTQLGKPRE